MNRRTNRLVLVAAILAAVCLSTGCASAINHIKAAASSLTPGHSVTVSPPTLSPTRTISPPTQAPTTVTEPPTTATVTAPASPSAHSAAPSTSPASGTSASSLLWLWIALGALVIIGLIVLIARRSGRRSAVATNWRSKAADARARGGSALYDAMSMAELRGPADSRAASARWADIQRRTDDLDQILYELRESAPGETERANVEDVLGSLQSVRSAMNTERTPGRGTAGQAARVHDLLRSFGESLRALRPPSDYGP